MSLCHPAALFWVEGELKSRSSLWETSDPVHAGDLLCPKLVPWCQGSIRRRKASPKKQNVSVVCGGVQFFGWQGLEEERDGKEIST